MTAVLEWLIELAQAFYWSFWIPGPHLALCRPIDDVFFLVFDFGYRGSKSLCNHPFVTVALASFIVVTTFIVIHGVIDIKRARRYQEVVQAQAHQAELAARSNALAVQRREEQETQAANQRWEEKRRREIAQERAAERLPEIERICLREWGHFKARTDPLDMMDLDTVRREFAPVFVRKYPTDAGLLWASNNVEVRAILTPNRDTWPRPQLT